MDGVAVFVAGRLRFLDRAATALLGHAGEGEALDRPLGGLLPPDAMQHLGAGSAPRAAAGPFRLQVARPDGSTVRLDAWVVPALYEGTEATEVVLRDPGAQGPPEQQADHRARLALLRERVASVAHELGDSLTGILAYATVLEQDPHVPDLEARLASLVAEARRALGTIDGLVGLPRHPPARRPTDLNQLVRDTVEIETPALRSSGISVWLDLQPALPQPAASAQQIQQALLILIRNAEDAIGAAGRQGNLALSTSRQGQAVAIRVEDNGCGIPAEGLASIFEPFFTTKPHGEGTRLGLAFCRLTVREHGGDIRVESVPGRGTAFTIFLPLGLGREADP